METCRGSRHSGTLQHMPMRRHYAKHGGMRDEVREAWMLIDPRKRRKFSLLVGVQVLSGVMDLVAVGLLGLVGALAVATVENQPATEAVRQTLGILHLGSASPQVQVSVLAAIATGLFTLRTILTIALTRRALFFLAARSAEVAETLVSRLLAMPLEFVEGRPSQEFQYAATAGVNALVVGLLGSIATVVADAAIALGLIVLLALVSPIVLGVLLVQLGLMTVIIQRFTISRAAELGRTAWHADVESRALIGEALATYRNAIVRGSRPRYAHAIGEIRTSSARVSAELLFLPGVSKYVMETGVVLGAVALAGVEFATSDARTAVTALTVFLAAGMRLAPAAVRLQQGAFAARAAAGQAKPALDLLLELADTRRQESASPAFTTEHAGFQGAVQFSDVSFAYKGQSVFAVRDATFSVNPGQMLALVGPSGAGKSTIADLLMGALEPTRGKILVSETSPNHALSQWPGAIGYVPQSVWIVDGSIRRNVTLGFEEDSLSDAAIWRALDAAELGELVRGLPGQLDAQVGERGTQLSGGQQQRLGIARALVTVPRLLILDEATSALDADTERAVSSTMRNMHGNSTLIVIAHRLATVRLADVVVYLDSGRVVAQGSFDDLKENVPEFNRQAALQGL